MANEVETLPEHYDGLREWANGSLPLVAATELLIRVGFAQPGAPWVKYDDNTNRPWIDFASIPELSGAKSGGEQRILRVAASLAGEVPIILGDDVAGLDRDTLDLALAAIAHSGGWSSPGRTIRTGADGGPEIQDVGALYSWPGDGH